MIIIIHEDSSTLAASHRPSISFSWWGKFSSPTIRKPRAWAACSLTCQSTVHQLVYQYSHVPNLQVATQIVSLQLTRGWNNLAKKQNKNKQTEQQKAPDIDGIIWWVDQWMACSPQTRCDSVVEHRSAETESLRFDSSWELRIVSLSHARDKTKNVFYFLLSSKLTIFLILFQSINVMNIVPRRIKTLLTEVPYSPLSSLKCQAVFQRLSTC